MESKKLQIQNESIFTFKYNRHLISCHYLSQENSSEPPFYTPFFVTVLPPPPHSKTLIPQALVYAFLIPAFSIRFYINHGEALQKHNPRFEGH